MYIKKDRQQVNENYRELCTYVLRYFKRYFTTLLYMHRYIDITINNLCFQFDHPVHHLSYPPSCHDALNFYLNITFIFVPKSQR